MSTRPFFHDSGSLPSDPQIQNLDYIQLLFQHIGLVAPYLDNFGILQYEDPISAATVVDNVTGRTVVLPMKMLHVLLTQIWWELVHHRAPVLSVGPVHVQDHVAKVGGLGAGIGIRRVLTASYEDKLGEIFTSYGDPNIGYFGWVSFSENGFYHERQFIQYSQQVFYAPNDRCDGFSVVTKPNVTCSFNYEQHAHMQMPGINYLGTLVDPANGGFGPYSSTPWSGNV